MWQQNPLYEQLVKKVYSATREKTVFPVLHPIFFLLGVRKMYLSHKGQWNVLYGPLAGKIDFFVRQREIKCTLLPASRKKTFILLAWLLFSPFLIIQLHIRKIHFFFPSCIIYYFSRDPLFITTTLTYLRY